MRNLVRASAVLLLLSFCAIAVFWVRLARGATQIRNLGGRVGYDDSLLPRITRLSFLSGTAMEREHAEAISRCVDLRALDLSETIVNKEFASNVAKLMEVEKLVLNGTEISFEDAQLLIRAFPNLRSLLIDEDGFTSEEL